MMSDSLQEAPPIPARRIGIAGSILIWFLAIAIYGGGLAAWFVSMPVIRPVVDGALSFVRAFSSHTSETIPASIADEGDASAVVPAKPAPSSASTQQAAAAEGQKSSFWGGHSSPSWPSIKVVGVLSKQGKQAVMLDKDIVPIHGSIHDISVIQIEAGRVLLEFENEQKWVLVGDKTDQGAP